MNDHWLSVPGIDFDSFHEFGELWNTTSLPQYTSSLFLYGRIIPILQYWYLKYNCNSNILTLREPQPY